MLSLDFLKAIAQYMVRILDRQGIGINLLLIKEWNARLPVIGIKNANRVILYWTKDICHGLCCKKLRLTLKYFI